MNILIMSITFLNIIYTPRIQYFRENHTCSHQYNFLYQTIQEPRNLGRELCPWINKVLVTDGL